MDSNQLHQALASEVFSSKRGFVQVGKLLAELKRDDNFRSAIGDGIDTWNAYLAQPEIGLSISEANRYIQIYEQFIQRFGYSEEEVATVPLKNLQTLLPLAKSSTDSDSEEAIRSLFQDAAHLSQRDFKERIYEATTDTEIRHYEYLVMKKCVETGSMRKVHDLPSDLIKATFQLDDAI